MDVTPQLLKDVEFRQKVRGYDPDEVDDFLERVGLAFAQLQDRLREANDQIEAANARAAHAPRLASVTRPRWTTRLRRTLVLAQRTADAAIKEAEEQAAAIRGEAETSAHQQLTGSEERASQVLGAAEAEARRKLDAADAQARTVVANGETQAEATLTAAREQANQLLADSRQQAEEVVATARTSADEMAESRRQQLAEEVSSLEDRRGALARNAELLDGHVNSQRLRLKQASDDLKALLEDPERLTASAPPELEDEPQAVVAEHRNAPAAVVAPAPSQQTPQAPVAAPTEPGDVPDLTGVSKVEIGEPAFMSGPDASGERPVVAADLGPQGAVDPVPTQPLDLTTLDRDEPEADRPVTPNAGEPPSPVVTPSSWPAGGPPPPPPPPVTTDRVGGDQRHEPPAPPPPPVAEVVGAGTGGATVPPWLAARTPPAAPPKNDAFYDQLRRAVGDDETGENTGEQTAAESAAAAPSAEGSASNGGSGDDSSKSWFGRRR